jgi:hypothetical protein
LDKPSEHSSSGEIGKNNFLKNFFLKEKPRLHFQRCDPFKNLYEKSIPRQQVQPSIRNSTKTLPFLIGRKAFRKFGIDFGPKIRTLTKLSFAFTAPKFGRNQFSSYLCGDN